MENANQIKNIVKEKYGEIAKAQGEKSCCGSSKVVDYTMFQDSYDNLEGHVQDADLGLGCGLPTEVAGIKTGDTVLDLGCGAGNDVFVARTLVGNDGKVIGLDMTEDMIELAEKNNRKLGFGNVEFRLGEIEKMPVEDDSIDVVISNCVLNLVPDKEKSFAEIYRVLKSGAHFCVSDIVIEGELNEELKKSAEMYAGCVAGAIQKDEYLGIIEKAGFKNVDVAKSKTITLPDHLLQKYLDDESLADYKNREIGIFSITVKAEK
ncbi:MAG: arsenite methyltransferase [Melioribacteraceae bacterium]|nr:arsenite methyltransferase [Melioribacteraceae bacterium]MCF8263517.1 arsenite methyltransferase [Melioribacteraceae bacterium]MCF8411899.1 arsenite methyltransferase [Melioribacteraceae bacterium]MCF8431829.1 arsenite methyltransferase [Melioribacteraceae bacterium]